MEHGDPASAQSKTHRQDHRLVVAVGPDVTLRRKSDLVQFRSMTKMMKEAIAVLHELPEERQETIARAIIDYASHDEGVYHLTHDERAEVRAGLAEIERGEVASDDEVRAVYKRIGV